MVRRGAPPWSACSKVSTPSSLPSSRLNARYVAGDATNVLSRLCQYSCATTPSSTNHGRPTTADTGRRPSQRSRSPSIASRHARLLSRKKVPVPLCASAEGRVVVEPARAVVDRDRVHARRHATEPAPDRERSVERGREQLGYDVGSVGGLHRHAQTVGGGGAQRHPTPPESPALDDWSRAGAPPPPRPDRRRPEVPALRVRRSGWRSAPVQPAARASPRTSSSPTASAGTPARVSASTNATAVDSRIRPGAVSRTDTASAPWSGADRAPRRA